MNSEHPRRSRGNIGAPVSISLVDNGPTCSRVYSDHDGDMDQYEHGKAYTQYSTGDRSACVSYVRYSDRFNTVTLPKQHCMVSKTTCDAANHLCVDRDSKVYKYKLKPPTPPKKCTRLKSTIMTNTEDRQYNKWTTICRNLFCNCKQSNKSSSKAGLEGNDQCNKYTDGKSSRSPSHYMPQYVSAGPSSSHYMPQYVSAGPSSCHYMSQFTSAGSSSDTLSHEQTRKALEWTRIKRLLFLVGILLGILVTLGVVVGTVVMAPQKNKG